MIRHMVIELDFEKFGYETKNWRIWDEYEADSLQVIGSVPVVPAKQAESWGIRSRRAICRKGLSVISMLFILSSACDKVTSCRFVKKHKFVKKPISKYRDAIFVITNERSCPIYNLGDEFQD